MIFISNSSLLFRNNRTNAHNSFWPPFTDLDSDSITFYTSVNVVSHAFIWNSAMDQGAVAAV